MTHLVLKRCSTACCVTRTKPWLGVLVGLAVWRGEDGCAKSAVSDSFSSLKEKEAFVDSRGMHIALLPSHRSYNQGLISADRSNKATLLLTIPRCLLSRLQRISHAQLVKLSCNPRAPALSGWPNEKPYGIGRSYRYTRHRAAVLVSGTDSVLEAFKHNPTDGSFSPLASQLSEYTKYLNQRFLSY